MNPAHSRRRAGILTVGLATLLAACGGGGGSPDAAPAPASPTAQADAGTVLPVDANPIDNPATADGLVIDSVLVENNVDPATGSDAADHLEIALSNTSSGALNGFEIYYTIADPATGISENYYTALPADFTIPAGGSRVAHFDDTGAPDHFPVNIFSLYYTDTNALEVTVTVSAADVAVQSATVQKDDGGAEVAD